MVGVASLLIGAVLAAPVTESQLEGVWCLYETEHQGNRLPQGQTWAFERDGIVRIVDAGSERKGVYVINNFRIETSLALQLAVETIDGSSMVALNRDTRYRFRRGECR